MGIESWVVGALILGPLILGKFFLVAQIGLGLVIAFALASAVQYYARFGPQVLSKAS
jgi:hypothetical protein